MRILHVAFDINPDRGGPPRSISGLCRALSNTANDVSLFVHDVEGTDNANLGRCRLYVGSGASWRGWWSRDMRRVLDVTKPDIVHFHGVWGLALHIDQAICRRRGIPYVISPKGSLSAWSVSHKAFKKRLALLLYQLRDLNNAAAIQTTCDMESGYVRRLGCRSRIITVPNGINFPKMLPPRHRDNGKRRFLFLSRISPEKGLIDLVRAWSGLEKDGWLLEIVGNDNEGYWPIVQTEINRLGCGSSIVRTPFLDDRKKWSAYRRADVFVHPSYTENFGIVIAEAMYAGLPVIATKGTPWKILSDIKAGWWVDVGDAPVKDAMAAAMKLDDGQRMAIGERGSAYVRQAFRWEEIAKRLLHDYAELLNKREPSQ